ncbi:MAG: fatty acid desaturase [Chitinophagaceae bacterium]|nr:fatty acid desaturase [Chitinophagaceae bacterium]
MHVIFIFFIIHWYASFFFQSFFHHRYAAHRHFNMSTNAEKLFYFCCFIIHGSSYISPYAYGIMHRLHHVHADTEDDPHSPAYHTGFFATMWQTRNSYLNIYIGKTIVDDKLKKDLPQWTAFDKIAHNWVTRVVWILIYIVFYIAFATAWWMYLFLPLTIIMTTFQGTIINWWAHKFGYVNYPMLNTSKNMIPVDILFCGDAYHNNHHKFPGRVKNSHRWFEIDPTYYITCLLQKVRIVQWRNQ